MSQVTPLHSEALPKLIFGCEIVDELATGIMSARQRGEAFEEVMARADGLDHHQVAFLARLLVHAAFSENDEFAEIKQGQLEKELQVAAFASLWTMECMGTEEWLAWQERQKAQ